jgi:hypothetical protein
MKTFSQFITEVYDKDVMGSSQIKKTGEGGRIGAERKKSTPERRRMKAVGGGKMEPVEYKDRKDIGQQRQRSTREQQPEKERGSKEVAKSYADKVTYPTCTCEDVGIFFIVVFVQILTHCHQTRGTFFTPCRIILGTILLTISMRFAPYSIIPAR